MNFAGSDYSSGSSRSALLGLAVRTRDSVSGKFKLRILWKRVAILFCTLCVVGYMGLMSALYFYFRYKLSFDDASYWKTAVMPFRMEAHRREMGEYYLKKGKEAFNEEEYGIARSYLAAGLARVSQ